MNDYDKGYAAGLDARAQADPAPKPDHGEWLKDQERYEDGCRSDAKPHDPAPVGETPEQVAAEAWDKGYVAGHSDAMRRMSDEPNAPTSPNPYRIAAKP